MISLSSYGFSVALHAGVLAAACWLALFMIRRLRLRATAALIFMAAIAVAPWASFRGTSGPDRKISAEPRLGRDIVRLPRWTVATLPAEPQTIRPETPARSQSVAASSIEETSAKAPAHVFPWPSPRQLAAAIWLGGSLIGAFFFILNVLRTILWLRKLYTPSATQCAQICAHLDQPMQPASFRISENECSPCVAGWLRPVIVLPDFLLRPGREQELRWVLAHEMGHLRGNDSRRIGVISIVTVLYWWNPFVHALAHEWAAARERLCDLAAAGELERFGYGRFLVDMAGRVPPGPPLGVAIVRRQRMRRMRYRIVSLLNARASDIESGGRAFRSITLLGLAAAIVITSGLTIAESQSPTDPAEPLAAAESAAPPWDRADIAWSDDPNVQLPQSPRPLEENAEPASPQIHSRFAVVYSAQPLGEDRSIIKAAESDAFREKLSADPSCVIAEFPGLTAHSGEQALVEVISEVIIPEDGGGSFHTLNLGWMIHLNTAFQGDAVRMETNVNFGYIRGKFAPSLYLMPKRPAPQDLPNINFANGKADGSLEPGDLLLTPLGNIDGVCYVTVVAETEQIDAAGYRIGPPRPEEIAPRQEKVRITGVLATFDLSDEVKNALKQQNTPKPTNIPGGALYSYQNIADRVTGIDLTRASLPRLLTQSKVQALEAQGLALKTEELAPVTIPSGTAIAPWRTLPLSLTAKTSRSFLKIRPALELAGDPSDFPPADDFEPSTWVVELPAEAPDTRRLLYLTAEFAPGQ